MGTKKLRDEIKSFNRGLSVHEQQTVLTMLSTSQHIFDHLKDSAVLIKKGFNTSNREALAKKYEDSLNFHLAGMMRANSTETLVSHQTCFDNTISQIGKLTDLKPVDTLEELKTRRAILSLAAVVHLSQPQGQSLTSKNVQPRQKLLNSVKDTIGGLKLRRREKLTLKEPITDIDSYVHKLEGYLKKFEALETKPAFTEAKKSLLEEMEKAEPYLSVDTQEQSQVLSLARMQSRSFASTRSTYLEPAADVKERMLDLGWIGLGTVIIISGLVLIAVAPWLALPILALGIAASGYGAIDLAKKSINPLQAALGYGLPKLGEKEEGTREISDNAPKLKLHGEPEFEQRMKLLETIKQRYKVAGVVASSLGLVAAVLGIIFPPLGLAIGIVAAVIAVGTGVLAVTHNIRIDREMKNHIDTINTTDKNLQEGVQAIVNTAKIAGPQPIGSEESEAVIISSLSDILDEETIQQLETTLGQMNSESEKENEETFDPMAPKIMPEDDLQIEEDNEDEGEPKSDEEGDAGPSTPSMC